VALKYVVVNVVCYTCPKRGVCVSTLLPSRLSALQGVLVRYCYNAILRSVLSLLSFFMLMLVVVMVEVVMVEVVMVSWWWCAE